MYDKLDKYLAKRGMKIKTDKSSEKAGKAKAMKGTTPKSVKELNDKLDALIDELFPDK